eukprot:4987175-Lingulodinium_polyedra.AAC.1
MPAPLNVASYMPPAPPTPPYAPSQASWSPGSSAASQAAGHGVCDVHFGTVKDSDDSEDEAPLSELQ